MKKIIIIVLVLLAAKSQASEILEIERGLTLAQIDVHGEANTLAVLEDYGTGVRALNISKISGVRGDIPTVYQRLGREHITELVLGSSDSLSSLYELDELVSPAGTGSHHFGIGFNYPKHADEVDQEHQPFLFLKTVQATRQQGMAAKSTTLLDYEVEICARPLQPIDMQANVDDVNFGFFLCGDFTDRAALLRNINLQNMQSGEGFSIAKSKKGYFPTGPYIVIPRDRNKFLENVSFSLYRNDVLKQQAKPSKMIWSLNEMVGDVFNANRTNRPTYSEKTDRWIVGDEVSRGAVFLTGTPQGVIMRPPSLSQKIINGVQYLISGAFLETSISDFVLEKHVQDMLKKKVFLQPGEKIQMSSTFMGSLSLVISEN